MEQNFEQDTLGKRIAALRKGLGLTQQELAEKTGVSPQAVSKWENDASCPDITMLPLLADLFHVTTDELLGVKPVEPHVVILEKEKETVKEEAHPLEQIARKNMHHWAKEVRWSSIAGCITLILVCLVFLLRATIGLFDRAGVSTWNYIWPLLVFGLGLSRVWKNHWFGALLLVIGAYEFIWYSFGVPFEISWYVILLAVAIVLLVRIIVRNLKGEKGPQFSFSYSDEDEDDDDDERLHGEKRVPSMSYNEDDYNMDASFSFGRHSLNYPRKVLRGGRLENNFDTCTVDLTKVTTFENDPLLEIEVNFGTTVILLPRNVLVTRKSEAAFASFTITGSPLPEADQHLIVRGEVNFGSLELRYVE